LQTTGELSVAFELHLFTEEEQEVVKGLASGFYGARRRVPSINTCVLIERVGTEEADGQTNCSRKQNNAPLP
jgi:hypothetical protein